MVESRNLGSNFGNLGTREEDWPDVDGVLDTEEGAEAMRRADAALHATIERSIWQRNAQLVHGDSIPRALSIKAQTQQDQLTDEERQLLHSRGDVVGKALARPDALTTDELHRALLWPPPDAFNAILNDNEVALLARRFHPADDARFSDVAMSQALGQSGAAQAAELLSSRLGLEFAVFHAALMRRVGQMHPMRQMAPAFPEPGPVHSSIPGAEFRAAQGQYRQGQHPGDITRAMTALNEQHRHGNVTEEEVAARNSEHLAGLRGSTQASSLFSSSGFASPWPATPPPSHADRFGSGPWPPTAKVHSPITLFAREAGVSGHGVEPGWSVLPEEQKAAYHARSETMRREAWAEYETTLAAGPSPFALPGPGQRHQPARNLAGLASRGERLPGVPARPGITSGLSVFRDEQNTEWQEVLRRWEALPEEQRQTYEARAVGG
ncbi:hypothetical protein LX32DRAFT_719920 [Colletotrichum zoysiae]|uniref:Uncharacterized protein n=1 Tax=Colletotrichum zoysiae TaxID=1216348 RepID=A0AAD9HIF3_9PEZI|nr:hypothetical protein LX32DRAFT_719920 [Colletotrichum zoysiae]